MPPLPFPNLRPTCPVSDLPEPCRSAVIYAIAEKGVPAPIAMTDALAAMGAVVHCGYDCEAPDGDRIPATINTCTVAPSGAGKGASLKVFFRLFLEGSLEIPAAEEMASGELPATGQTESSGLTGFVTGKITHLSLVDALAGRGKNLTIQREEGASFLKSDLFKEDADTLTQLWSGSPPLDYTIRGKALKARDARCSVGFRIQPVFMEEYLRKRGRLSYKLGFWPRSIAACHNPVRFPANSDCECQHDSRHDPDRFLRRMARLAERLARRARCPRALVRLSDDAKAFMLELQYCIGQWEHEYYLEIPEAVGRAWENTLRVATVLHVFCVGRGPVSRTMAELAWQIVEWSLSQHQLIFIDSLDDVASRQDARVRTPPWVGTRAASRPPKRPRPMENANLVFNCLQRFLQSQGAIAAPRGLIQMVSGLNGREFEAALAWLAMEKRIACFIYCGDEYLQMPAPSGPYGTFSDQQKNIL